MKKLLFAIIFLIFVNYSYSQWISNFNGPNTRDNNLQTSGEAITNDIYGNSYVTGYYYSVNKKNNIFTIKYDPNGDTVWTSFYNGSGNDEDKEFGIVVDNDGFVYVTGITTSVATSSDIILLKYSSTGDIIWEREYSGTETPLEDKAFGIVVDNDGYIVITGYCTDTDGFKDILVLKYSNSGDLIWTAREDGEDNKDSQGLALTADNNNNYYITGFIASISDGEDIILLKYNTSGNKEFLNIINGPANKNERGLAITLDNNNNILICGYITKTTKLKTALFLAKFNNSGSKEWDKTYNGQASSSDKALGIVVDADNYVYVTGYTGYADSVCSMLTLKYNPSGRLIWNKTYNGTGNGNDVAYKIGIVDNYAAVIGKSWGIDQNYDLTIVTYKISDGNQESVITYSLNGKSNDIPTSINISSNRDLFITGYSEINKDESIIPKSCVTTLKLNLGKSSELFSDPNLPSNYKLYQNYPNPFNPSTTIKFDITKYSLVKITIYDILGRTVDVLYNSHLEAGTHTLDFNNDKLSSGIYFYELKTDDFKDIKKMTLIK